MYQRGESGDSMKAPYWREAPEDQLVESHCRQRADSHLWESWEPVRHLLIMSVLLRVMIGLQSPGQSCHMLEQQRGSLMTVHLHAGVFNPRVPVVSRRPSHMVRE